MYLEFINFLLVTKTVDDVFHKFYVLVEIYNYKYLMMEIKKFSFKNFQ